MEKHLFFGNLRVVQLLKDSARIDIPFLSACEYFKIKIIELLLQDQRVDINKKNMYPITC